MGELMGLADRMRANELAVRAVAGAQAKATSLGFTTGLESLRHVPATEELARFGQAQLDPMTVAQVFKASGMFPDIQSEAAACAKIIIGRGLGLTDFDAMTGLHIIKGKAVLAANLMAASIKRATGKYDYRATVTDTMCEITFFQRNDARAWEEIGTTTFTMDDARRAQLGSDNWRKYPRNMLFARCISNGYKAFCPDALGAAPVYVEAHGEMEITEDAPRSRAALPVPAAPEVMEAATLPQDASEAPRRLPAPKTAGTPQKASGGLRQVSGVCAGVEAKESKAGKAYWRIGLEAGDGVEWFTTFKKQTEDALKGKRIDLTIEDRERGPVVVDVWESEEVPF